MCFDSAFLLTISPDASSTRQPFCAKPHSPLDRTRRRVRASTGCVARPHPAAGRMPSRVARSRPQALCATHTTRAPPCPVCHLSLVLTASHPRVWRRECSRGLGCAGPVLAQAQWRYRHRLVTPTPSQARLRGRHTRVTTGLTARLPWPLQCAARAFGASGRAASVSRPFLGPTPSVHSPLHTYDSALFESRVSQLGSGPPWSNPGKSLLAAEPARFPPLRLVALSAPRSPGARPAVSLSCATRIRAGPLSGGPVRSTPHVLSAQLAAPVRNHRQPREGSPPIQI